ncbi:hypothetical protein CY34DRAFT_814444 [Suillus luteus UH-Slu-Lm8-n1]|uniref:Uncharacterized protein n=1 Tax=Suillus luteus UH-Slu-Lm8-n1 TaxID=930992 RepID=A0A0D0A1L9_9AGAM|nr:hypothetical protein CY34DRAFT_814444 [Suillus luteus UH-Slu-Lm8-n1]
MASSQIQTHRFDFPRSLYYFPEHQCKLCVSWSLSCCTQSRQEWSMPICVSGCWPRGMLEDISTAGRGKVSVSCIHAMLITDKTETRVSNGKRASALGVRVSLRLLVNTRASTNLSSRHSQMSEVYVRANSLFVNHFSSTTFELCSTDSDAPELRQSTLLLNL